jgi:hypothetical protein
LRRATTGETHAPKGARAGLDTVNVFVANFTKNRFFGLEKKEKTSYARDEIKEVRCAVQTVFGHSLRRVEIKELNDGMSKLCINLRILRARILVQCHPI